ncbi:MAG: ATP-binding protein, partial [Coprobacillus sp.]
MGYEITQGIINGAQKVVFYGPEGIGKSTFASKFPEPLFIDTEGSTKKLPVKRLPKPTSWQMLIDMVKDVIQKRQCKTLVIDTADWAERLCTEAVCASHGYRGVED